MGNRQELAKSITGVQASGVSDALGKFCVFTNSATVADEVELAGDGVFADGVIGENADAGQAVPVVIPNGGKVMVLAGGSQIAKGANVAVGAGGVAITAASSDIIVGVALETIDANSVGTILFSGYRGTA